MIQTGPRKVMTEELSKNIYTTTSKAGVFGCFEVTIGFGGSERVDYMTYDTNGIIKCYEVKSSKEDFYSGAKWSFCGHYNYFVMTKELYDQVKHDIPPHVGVYAGGVMSIKRAKRMNEIDVELLKDSLIRSLSREFEKSYKSQQVEVLQRLEEQNKRLLNAIGELRYGDNRPVDVLKRLEEQNERFLNDVQQLKLEGNVTLEELKQLKKDKKLLDIILNQIERGDLVCRMKKS